MITAIHNPWSIMMDWLLQILPQLNRTFHNPQRVHDGEKTVSVPLELFGKARRKYRMKLLRRNPVCIYCGRQLCPSSATLDHVTPVNRGGRNFPANLVLACFSCNSDKTDYTLAEWRATLRNRAAAMLQLEAKVATVEASGLEYFPVGDRIVTDHVPKLAKAKLA